MSEETFETPQPNQPAEPKPTNWPKMILAAVLGLGLLAGVAYAGYWYGTESSKPKSQISKPQLKTQIQETPTPEPTPTPTPVVEDETADWETYANTGYGYSIKYPRGWVKLEEGNNYVRFFKGPYPEEGMPMTETYISISLQDNPNKLSLENWLEENPSPYGVAKDVEEVDKRPAIKYVSDAPVGLGRGSTLIYSEKGKNIYQIALILRGLDIEEARQVFDLMLPTFKFLD